MPHGVTLDRRSIRNLRAYKTAMARKRHCVFSHIKKKKERKRGGRCGNKKNP
jgi:hypothetical protein